MFDIVEIFKSEIFNLKSLYYQNFNFIKILVSDLELAFFIFGDLDFYSVLDWMDMCRSPSTSRRKRKLIF